jgi:hypothetical protein
MSVEAAPDVAFQPGMADEGLHGASPSAFAI